MSEGIKEDNKTNKADSDTEHSSDSDQRGNSVILEDSEGREFTDAEMPADMDNGTETDTVSNHDQECSPISVVTIDDQCDGEPDGCIAEAWEAERDFLTLYFYSNCDGEPDYCLKYAFDDKGNMLSSAIDDRCNGTEDAGCFSWTYDENGNKLSELEDNDCDSKPDLCNYWTYDAEGNVQNAQYDIGCDGLQLTGLEYNVCFENTYDSAGNLLISSWDDSCNGKINGCYVYTYDEQGNRLTKQGDADCDGTIGGGCYTWTYDANGNVLTEQTDIDCDGTPHGCHMWNYDDHGHLLSSSADHDCDGVSDSECYSSTYSSDGNPTTFIIDENCDEIPERCDEYKIELDCGEKRYSMLHKKRQMKVAFPRGGPRFRPTSLF